MDYEDRKPWQVRAMSSDSFVSCHDTQREATDAMASKNQEAAKLGISERYRTHGPVYFCCGKYCPGYEYAASHLAHPVSCIYGEKTMPDQEYPEALDEIEHEDRLPSDNEVQN